MIDGHVTAMRREPRPDLQWRHSQTGAVSAIKILAPVIFSFPTIHSNPVLQNHSPILAIISFLRRFFASSVSPAAMSAAKTKAQGIIDENAVGNCI